MPRPVKAPNPQISSNSTGSVQQQIRKVSATSLFYANRDAKAQVVVNRGGSGSGKSHAIAQVLLDYFFNGPQKRILVLRKSLPALRQSVYIMMKKIVDELGLWDFIVEEKVHMNWYYNGSMIHFGGLDDPEKVKSSDWNYVWMEEATEFTLADFRMLKLRLREKSLDLRKNRMFLSFNPIDETHWIKEKLVDDFSQDLIEIVSTYRDNPFLPDDYVRDLQTLEYQDQMYWKIYSEGEWGRLENLIYKNWAAVEWMPEAGQCEHCMFGLDFGYNEPTALVKTLVKGKDIWEKELLYQTKLTNADLIDKLRILIPPEERRYTIYADAAEPDRIFEIKQAGFKIKPAQKAILDGIDQVKRYNIHIFSESTNLIKEKKSYSWRSNKNGDSLDIPIDFLNHLMDAERYAIYTHLKGRGGLIKIRYIN